MPLQSTHPPRIGLNLLYLLPGVVGGTETYAAGLLQGLAEEDDGLEYVVFVNQESADWPLPQSPCMHRVVCPVRATNRVRRLVFEQTRLPGLVRRRGLDVLHSLGYIAPLPGSCPGVVTIHDMNTKGHGQSMPWLKRMILASLVRRGAYAARMVITVSEFSRREIHRHLGLPLERIQVVHEAPLPPAPAMPDNAPLPDIGGPFVLAFASLSRHKNIVRLIQAFSRIAAYFPHKLVLAGHVPDSGEIDAAIRRHDVTERVVVTGFLPGSSVRGLLAKADLFAFPSLYEGFGLPLLEAQAADTPVACSNRGALPEVAGGSALLFDPEQVVDMAATLAHALSQEEVRRQLVAQGRVNLKRFSWAKAARETLRIYARAAWQDGNRYVRDARSGARLEHADIAPPVRNPKP